MLFKINECSTFSNAENSPWLLCSLLPLDMAALNHVCQLLEETNSNSPLKINIWKPFLTISILQLMLGVYSHSYLSLYSGIHKFFFNYRSLMKYLHISWFLMTGRLSIVLGIWIATLLYELYFFWVWSKPYLYSFLCGLIFTIVAISKIDFKFNL